jgi:hypothetical protein
MRMNRFALLTVFLLMAVNIAYAKVYEVKRIVGQCDVVIKSDKNPPIAGDNNVSIEVTDASGQRLSDVMVAIEYSRPARPGSPPMNYKVDTVKKGSRYIGKMSLSMAGPWNIAVKITRGGKTWTTNITVDVE